MTWERGKSLLVVVAKAPVPGKVKTRLIPHLTPEQAADLYRCFLQDRIGAILTMKQPELAIAYTPSDARDAFVPLGGNGLRLFPQEGKNLGERLNNIFLKSLAEGFDAVCVIDSDSPDLPMTAVRESFERLQSGRTDVVLGPCHDGGYYLVGMRKPHPELFVDIPWRTGRVLADTIEKARLHEVRVDLLPRWNDLDTIEDLIDFYDLHRDAAAGKGWAGEKTFRYLNRLRAGGLTLSAAGQRRTRRGQNRVRSGANRRR